MKKICILTLGCKVNQYESEAMGQMFPKDKYDVTFEFSPADAYIINTCSVTNISDRKSRQMIRKCTKQDNSPFVAVTGCYSHAKPEEATNIEGVNFVLGTENKTKLVKVIEEYFGDTDTQISDRTDGFDFPLVTDYKEKTRAIVKIQDGCNSFCSYCIIPYVRGRCRSRDPKEIIEEISSLADNGYKEIVLAGIHVCNYGIDLDDMTFPKLLSMIEAVPNIERIRLSSVEPLAFTEEFYEFFKNSKKLCPHFHISLQSGSDSVIKRMNRHYTGEYFLNTVKRLKSINPNTSVTTDIIVGFPEETQEEFNETVELVKKAGFLKIHTFKYSKRNGTKAAEMENQVSETVKDERSKIIIKLSEMSEKEILSSYIGRTLSVLFEEEKNGYMHGFSENYIPVFALGGNELKEKIKNVKIERIDGLNAIGNIIE